MEGLHVCTWNDIGSKRPEKNLNFFNSKMNPFRICQAKDYYIFLNKRFTYLVNNDSLCLNSTLTFEKLSGSII